MHASRSTGSDLLAVLVQQATACGLRFAGSVSCFTSIAIDRARRSSPVARSCQRSEVFRLQTKDVTWPGVACAMMQVNDTGHAQRLNMLKERSRKWFFREEVDFLSSLAFVVN